MIKYAYVSGPYRGKDMNSVRINIRNAEKRAESLLTMNTIKPVVPTDLSRDFLSNSILYPVTPHLLTGFMDGAVSDDLFLDATLGLMLKCDLVCLFGNWLHSMGAVKEVITALKNNIPVYDDTDVRLTSVSSFSTFP